MNELNVKIRLDRSQGSVRDQKDEAPPFRLEIDHGFDRKGITALYGPSGCGKTTLLRIIAGLEQSAEGEIAWAKERWLSTSGPTPVFVPPDQRKVGMVFQDIRLFPHLSVMGNLRFAAKRARRGHSSSDLEPVIETLDLEPLLQRRPASLSRGEQQRVAIGRSLLAKPRLLLMDEPVSGLDSLKKSQVIQRIAQLPSEFDLPILYVTHAIDEVAQLADRMLVLAQGRIVKSGSTNEVLGELEISSDQGAFEAGQLLDATIIGHDSRYALTRLDVLGQELVMPRSSFSIGEVIRLRLRARDVALATVRPESISIRNVLRGQIREVRGRHDSPHADVSVGLGEKTSLMARVTRQAAEELGLQSGREVFALIKSIAVDRSLPGTQAINPPNRE